MPKSGKITHTFAEIGGIPNQKQPLDSLACATQQLLHFLKTTGKKLKGKEKRA